MARVELNIARMRVMEEELVLHLFQAAGMEARGANGAFFQDEDNILLVASVEGQPAGFLYAYVLEAPHLPQPKMFLYSIDVFPDFQGRGVGTALIEKLKGMALARGCSEIFVLTNASNSAANRLYQKTGGIRENPDDVMYVYLLQQEPLLD